MPNKNKKEKEIVRQCAVCGADFTIVLLAKGHYQNGHYFGKVELADGTEEEYWECDICGNDDETKPKI